MSAQLNLKRNENQPIDIGVERRDRKELADELSVALADTYVLYGLTQHVHWNVTGPLFYSLHKLTESQYRELFESIDEIAERIRALGLPAPQSFREFADRSILGDLPEEADLQGRIEHMIADYERAVRRASLVVQLAESNGDIKTSGMPCASGSRNPAINPMS